MTTVYSGVETTTYMIENLSGQSDSTVIYGEYIQYTFPVKINITTYRIEFAEDSKPVAWSIFAKTIQGYWKLLDDQEFINETDQFTLDTNFPSSFYENHVKTQYVSDVVRLHIQASTGTSVKIKNFKIYDDKGIHRHFIVPFCTTTNGHAHTGSLNFSHVDNCSLIADLNTDFFAVSHNMIVIENGMADTIFK
jgi:hypothetical protein